MSLIVELLLNWICNLWWKWFRERRKGQADRTDFRTPVVR